MKVEQPYRHLIIFHSLTMHTCTFIDIRAILNSKFLLTSLFSVCFEGYITLYAMRFRNFPVFGARQLPHRDVENFLTWISENPQWEFSRVSLSKEIFFLKFRHSWILQRIKNSNQFNPFFLPHDDEEKGCMCNEERVYVKYHAITAFPMPFYIYIALKFKFSDSLLNQQQKCWGLC